MTLFRGTFVDGPADPFAGGALRWLDGAIVVFGGRIVARGSWASLHDHPEADRVVDLSEGLVLPGMVDAHVHFPQVRVIGALGLHLLEWLERRALPEEQRLADATYAREVARDFLGSLARAGTTSALVFGAHFASAMEVFFTEAAASGLRISSGLVVSDRGLPPPLLTTPERAVAESVALAERWHGRGRLRYAVTPRFSLSCSDALLAACAGTRATIPGSLFTSHVNESAAEIAAVEAAFGTHYVGTFDRHGLLDRLSVLAHDVHPRDEELAVLGARGTSVAHCPSSNAALGSGMFPLKRHLAHGVRLALGSDVGGGVSFSLLREGLQAAFIQNLLGEDGLPLGPAHLLWLATTAGAEALGLESVGHLSVGREFDAVWLHPAEGTTLQIALRHAADAADAVAKSFALGDTSDVRGVWVAGERIRDGDPSPYLAR